MGCRCSTSSFWASAPTDTSRRSFPGCPTLPAITAAREILIVAFGAGKKEIVGEALLSRAGGESSPPNLLPVQRVKGARWLIDAAAAQGLGVEEKE